MSLKSYYYNDGSGKILFRNIKQNPEKNGKMRKTHTVAFITVISVYLDLIVFIFFFI